MAAFVLQDQASTKSDERSLLDDFRRELDGFWRSMQDYAGMEPDQVLLHISSASARVGQIRTWIVRSEARQWQKFRTTEVDPFLDQCDFQFKVHSRLQSIRQFDYELAKGQP